MNTLDFALAGSINKKLMPADNQVSAQV
jgi:hypothetical protein